ncbi:MAG: hypothetical protein ABEH43_08875, partial [Flavobacteriales bacterium]
KEKEQKKLSNIKPSDFLSAGDYDRLNIEILYVENFKPTNQALDSLKAFLKSYLHKPKGINFTFSSISSPSNNSYSLSKLKDIEDINRSIFPEENTLGAYIFFA